jgi:hypothetical protein
LAPVAQTNASKGYRSEEIVLCDQGTGIQGLLNDGKAVVENPIDLGPKMRQVQTDSEDAGILKDYLNGKDVREVGGICYVADSNVALPLDVQDVRSFVAGLGSIDGCKQSVDVAVSVLEEAKQLSVDEIAADIDTRIACFLLGSAKNGQVEIQPEPSSRQLR